METGYPARMTMATHTAVVLAHTRVTRVAPAGSMTTTGTFEATGGSQLALLCGAASGSRDCNNITVKILLP